MRIKLSNTTFNAKKASKASTLLRSFLEEVIQFTSVVVNFAGSTDSNGSEEENYGTSTGLDDCNETDSMDRDRVESENARSSADYFKANSSPADRSKPDTSTADSSLADSSLADCCTECSEGKQEFEI